MKRLVATFLATAAVSLLAVGFLSGQETPQIPPPGAAAVVVDTLTLDLPVAEPPGASPADTPAPPVEPARQATPTTRRAPGKPAPAAVAAPPAPKAVLVAD